ncbi:MAG: glycosyltransferase family 39 protein [Chloroflexota bacterium]|nr:glycosyltransferase family 39 protein [Chloroflexota bacterium]
MTSKMSFSLVVILLLVAALLRSFDLANLPQGFSEDEIINIRLVDNVRQGDIFAFYPGEDGGREGFYPVFVAFVTSFVGEGTIGFRIASLWLSMLSIAIIYTLGLHLFNPVVGVLAASLVTVNMSSILLARAVSSDAIVLFWVSATMLALARSLPVYRRTRVVTSNIISFAALGALLGIGFYVHPSSLFIALGAMAYIVHLLYVRDIMFRQRRSYTGFAILLMLIISMPYVISSINLPQYSAVHRIASDYNVMQLHSIVDGLLAIVAQGDANPLHNLPGRPLVDAFSGLFMLVGVLICFMRRHRPRFMLMLIMFVLTLPAALIVEGSPNFHRMNVLLPQLAIFFGMGVYSVIRAPIFADFVFRRMAVAGLLVLLVINIAWTATDLYADWRDNEEVLPLVNGGLGQIAHYLDVVGDEIPVVFCNAAWDAVHAERAIGISDKTLLMMNRSEFVYREADCSQSLLLANGGEKQRIVFFDEAAMDGAHPYLREWLAQGQSVMGKLPRNTVIELETVQLLADRAGALTTTAPLSYAPEVAALEPIAPPIRFGGNLTLLGYEPDVKREFLPGEIVDVITYWRVEGAFLSDIILKNHVLADPVTPIGIRDVISVNPLMLRERDVFIQVTPVQLRETTLPGNYIVSVGAYRQSDQQRLPVLKDDQPHGDRIFLYNIEVLPLPATDESGG